jgi:uncharacterized membrane protein YoaK (UPF0700 family)
MTDAMRTDAFKDVLAARNQTLWLLLGFQAGFMNTGGFLACHEFVSHVTGDGTTVGVALGSKRYLVALETAMAPLFFLLGATYSGWLADREVLLGREPRIMTGVVTLAALNLAVFLGGILGFVGPFGEPLDLQYDFLLLFTLSFACGLQNGLFTSLSGGKVRTTHLTGPTTDMGLNLAKVLTLRRGDPERGRLSLMNWLRAKLIVAFAGGSMIATLVFVELSYWGFAVPLAISVFLVWYVHRLLKIGEGGAAAEEAASLLGPVDPGHPSR